MVFYMYIILVSLLLVSILIFRLSKKYFNDDLKYFFEINIIIIIYMPCGQMNFGKCYRKVGRLAYLNIQNKPNVTRDYGSGDARARAIRRRVGRFSTIGGKKNYGPLFGLKKTFFDNSCRKTNVFYYTANTGNASDVIFWKKNYGGSKNLMISGEDCNAIPCISNNSGN